VTAGHPPPNVHAIDARSDFELTVTGREAGLDAHRLQAPDCPSNAVRRNDFLHIGLPQGVKSAMAISIPGVRAGIPLLG
jgi:hypothetical protein